jgi:hypothetical protein
MDDMSREVDDKLSVPRSPAPTRDLTAEEAKALERIADVLVPACHDAPAATDEPGFWDQIPIALRARAEAFDSVVAILTAEMPEAPDELWAWLRERDRNDPNGFQALSSVIAGAWLLTDTVRARIGSYGPRSVKARAEDVVDELETGILAPVLEMAEANPQRWWRPIE